MTRTGAKWITMAMVLVLTAGAWAQRERESDRDRPERRGEGRSMADRGRDERERNERAERQRREERQRDEHRRNEERERDEQAERQRNEERQRDEHRRNEERERNERDEHRDRDERRDEEPELRIFRLEHAPAESIIDVIHQLGERGPLKEILSQIPFAVHEHSNAIVVIAPPRALEMFERLAEGLDKPSEFHRRMAQQHRPAPPRQPQILRRPAPPKQPQILRRPGAPKQPAPKRPAAAQRHDEINADAILRAIGNPVGEMFCKLLSEPTARELRLDGKQREAIRKLAEGCGQRVRATRQRVLQLIGDIPPQQRAANARKVVSIARGEMGRAAGEVRKRIFSILRPEQRKPAARLLGSPGPTAKPSGCNGKCGGKCPTCRAKAGAKGGCGGCGSKAKPTPAAAPRGCGSGARPAAVPGKPRPAAAPAGCGGGGCGSRKSPGIVMSDQGNCKTSDF